jgi:hypothetical protein
LAGFERTAANGRAQQHRSRRRGSAVPLAGSAAIVLVLCVGGAVFWWGHKSPRLNKAPAAASVARAALVQKPLPVVAPSVSALPAVARAAVAPGVAIPTVVTPTVAAPSADAKPAVSEANREFALLGPSRGPVSDTRPEFSWQPLSGAVKYSVVIVDSGLHRVQRSRALRNTTWRPRRPLRRGRTYLWQVTATLRGGHKVVASAPGTLIVGAADSPHEPQ